jgi:hypothetical protein
MWFLSGLAGFYPVLPHKYNSLVGFESQETGA